jgi:RNA polymerase sigma-70 factor (ECF subfamily)
MLKTDNANIELVLFQSVRQGDEEAFRVLFLRYYRLLSRYTTQITKNEEEAQELVSDVFLLLWDKRNSIQIGLSVRQYLYAMCRNKALRHLKSKRHPASVTLTPELTEALAQEPADEYEDPALSAPRGLSAADSLYRFIEKLPGKRQVIFRMNKLEGLSYHEIAGQLGLSEKTVKNQVFRAMEQLRHMSFALFLLYVLRH